MGDIRKLGIEHYRAAESNYIPASIQRHGHVRRISLKSTKSRGGYREDDIPATEEENSLVEFRNQRVHARTRTNIHPPSTSSRIFFQESSGLIDNTLLREHIAY